MQEEFETYDPFMLEDDEEKDLPEGADDEDEDEDEEEKDEEVI